MTRDHRGSEKRSDGAANIPPEAETTYRLMQRASSGDPEAADLLCRRFLPRLQRWAHGRLPKSARGVIDTEDIVQDVLSRTLERLDQLEYPRCHALQAYVRRAVDHRIRDELRRRANRNVQRDSFGELPAPEPSPLEQLVGREVLDNYETALCGLRPIEQESIVARMELGYSFAEVADILGLPGPDAARKRVKRALVKLAAAMS
jgi:RNA polymerase sigma-70 factor (ECF subfamily)